MTDLLQQGITAARAGRRAEARELLMRVVEADQRSEQGWLWLSGVVEDPEDIRTCLLNVLDINPDSARAKQGLAWVEQRYGMPQQARMAPAASEALPVSVTPAAPAASEVQPALEPAPQSAPPESAAGAVAIERVVGTSYTKTTVDLQPVDVPPTHFAVPETAAPPKRAPSPPTERFRGDVPGVDTAPREQAVEPPADDVKPGRPSPRHTRPEQTAMYEPVQPVAQITDVDNPCPYCGAPTTLAQQRCTQCRGDLMVRAAPPEQRSLALKILGALWSVGGGLMLLLTAALLAMFFVARQAAQVAMPAPAADNLLAAGAVALLLGLLYLGIGRGLRARQRWAYYANIALVALNLAGAVVAVAAGALFAGALLAILGPARAPGLFGTIGLVVAAVLGLGFALLPLVLTVMSYRDFVGPLVRFQASFEDLDHMAHYNNGIAYRDRGMWYKAAQEWEAAARKKPREASYLHALGLAYARLKRFEQARATLDSALRAAPEDAGIKQSRALVDQMAAQAST